MWIGLAVIAGFVWLMHWSLYHHNGKCYADRPYRRH